MLRDVFPPKSRYLATGDGTIRGNLNQSLTAGPVILGPIRRLYHPMHRKNDYNTGERESAQADFIEQILVTWGKLIAKNVQQIKIDLISSV
jgi:hypothetical protein